MIGYLKGTIAFGDTKSLVLDVNGVGYKLFSTIGFLDSMIGDEAEFFTHLAVRENALDLYGFKSREELAFFELLLSVSGIGPKSALGILSIASLSALKNAIVTGDSTNLVKTSGVGKKNADKIVLELKGKVTDLNVGVETIDENDDALDALMALGYSERESREALKKTTSTETGARIKEAMKNIR